LCIWVIDSEICAFGEGRFRQSLTCAGVVRRVTRKSEQSVYVLAVANREDSDESGLIIDAVKDSEITAADPIVGRFFQFLCTNRPLLRLEGEDQFLNTAPNRWGEFEEFLFRLLDDLNQVPGHALFLRLEERPE